MDCVWKWKGLSGKTQGDVEVDKKCRNVCESVQKFYQEDPKYNSNIYLANGVLLKDRSLSVLELMFQIFDRDQICWY